MEKTLKFILLSVFGLIISFAIMWLLQLGGEVLNGIINILEISENHLWILILVLLLFVSGIISKLSDITTNLPYSTKYRGLKKYSLLFGIFVFVAYFVCLLIIFAGAIYGRAV